MSVLDEGIWSGKLFLGGWRVGRAGSYPVIEPATGKEIGRIGGATSADVAEASAIAVAAQRDWAAYPPRERGEILRRTQAGRPGEAGTVNIGYLMQPPHNLRILGFLRTQARIDIPQAGRLRHRRQDRQAAGRERISQT